MTFLETIFQTGSFIKLFCNKTMPHLNGSLTNIFTVINVFRDIIPLCAGYDAFRFSPPFSLS